MFAKKPKKSQDNENFDDFFLAFEDIAQQDLSEVFNQDMSILKKVCVKPFSPKSFVEIVQAFNPDRNISELHVLGLFMQLKKLNSTNHVPFLKCFFVIFHVYEFLKKQNLECIPAILRVIVIYLSVEQKLLDKPILYHGHIMNILPKLEEASVLEFCTAFESVCDLGTLTLNNAISMYSEFESKATSSNILKKLYEDRLVFKSIFTKPTMTITQMMTLFLWKRDKAARTLNMLVESGYFNVQIFHRKKVYVNVLFLEILKHIHANKEIQHIISKYL